MSTHSGGFACIPPSKTRPCCMRPSRPACAPARTRRRRAPGRFRLRMTQVGPSCRRGSRRRRCLRRRTHTHSTCRRPMPATSWHTGFGYTAGCPAGRARRRQLRILPSAAQRRQACTPRVCGTRRPGKRLCRRNTARSTSSIGRVTPIATCRTAASHTLLPWLALRRWRCSTAVQQRVARFQFRTSRTESEARHRRSRWNTDPTRRWPTCTCEWASAAGLGTATRRLAGCARALVVGTAAPAAVTRRLLTCAWASKTPVHVPTSDHGVPTVVYACRRWCCRPLHQPGFLLHIQRNTDGTRSERARGVGDERQACSKNTPFNNSPHTSPAALENTANPPRHAPGSTPLRAVPLNSPAGSSAATSEASGAASSRFIFCERWLCGRGSTFETCVWDTAFIPAAPRCPKSLCRASATTACECTAATTSSSAASAAGARVANINTLAAETLPVHRRQENPCLCPPPLCTPAAVQALHRIVLGCCAGRRRRQPSWATHRARTTVHASGLNIHLMLLSSKPPLSR